MTEHNSQDKVEVTVCICTFRRPSIIHTVSSVCEQALQGGVLIGILIIDNDDVPSAQDAISDFSGRVPLGVRYVHAPGRNISVARNAALDSATTRWVAFIDDDEYASPTWLAHLLARRESASAVFGPCEAIYPAEASTWIRDGDYHSNRIIGDGAGINTGYSSNVLIDMTFVRRHGVRFDTALGRTGGEDTMFFRSLSQKGGQLQYASDALVYEKVAPARINLRWIAIRKYRAGQTYALTLRSYDRLEYYRACLSAPLKIATCIMMSITLALRPSRAMWWLLRGIFHGGVMSYAAGLSIHEEYRSKRNERRADS